MPTIKEILFNLKVGGLSDDQAIQFIHSYYLEILNEERIAEIVRVKDIEFREINDTREEQFRIELSIKYLNYLAKAIVAKLTKSMEEK